MDRVRSLKDAEIAEMEFRLKQPDHSYRWFLTRATAFSRRQEGSVEQIIGVAEDISERKAAENALRHRLDLERLIAQISSHLINIPDSMVDQGIDDSLRMLLDFTRCSIPITSRQTWHTSAANFQSMRRCIPAKPST
jgi:PAS domain-containing protein